MPAGPDEPAPWSTVEQLVRTLRVPKGDAPDLVSRIVGEAVRIVQNNRHIGKIAVLCQADRPGLGVTDPELRARVGGDDRLNPLRGMTAVGEGE